MATIEHPLSGFPIHLRERGIQDGVLTRCGLFATGLHKRVTDQPTVVDCLDCLSEGPASAFLLLPDGQVIDRRSEALTNYPFALVTAHATNVRPRRRLQYWAADLTDATFLRRQIPARFAPRIIPVRFAAVTY